MGAETFHVHTVALQYLLMIAPKRFNSILETKVNSYGLNEVVIRCNRCASQLHLTGFSLLQKLSETGEEKSKNKREEPIEYITHI